MRSCQEVIRQIIEKIPVEKVDFIKDLEWNFEDAGYKAPEETLQWERTQYTLMKHMPKPILDWEYEILSIFTMRSKEDLQKMFENGQF